MSLSGSSHLLLWLQTVLTCPNRHAIALPVVGVVLSLTAAYDFKEAHARVKNLASGTLDADQTVTFEEMLEHSFYQGLNVAQAVCVRVCVVVCVCVLLPACVACARACVRACVRPGGCEVCACRARHHR
jgi:hypothetical protein